jgi:hypothetical protein
MRSRSRDGSGGLWDIIRQAVPIKQSAAQHTLHVIAAAILLDVSTAFGAGLRNFLDGLQRLLLLGDLDLVATSRAVPRAHTGQAHVILAIRAGYLLAAASFALVGLALAVLDREVMLAFRVQAGNIVFAIADVVLQQRGVQAAYTVSVVSFRPSLDAQCLPLPRTLEYQLHDGVIVEHVLTIWESAD